MMTGLARGEPARRIRSPVVALLLATATCSSPQVPSPPWQTVEHRVTIVDPDRKIFAVVSNFSGLDGDSLEVALPRWTPGYYALVPYANSLRKLRAVDGDGNHLTVRSVGIQRWRILLHGAESAEVSFQVGGDTLGLNRARIATDWAVFTGTQLFLHPLGREEGGATVLFELPPGWNVATSLARGNGPLEYDAGSYDELADTPFFLGHFQRKDFTIDGVPHFISVIPDTALSTSELDTVSSVAASIANEQKKLFGDSLPYQRYGYMLVFQPVETGLGGGIEHGSSFLGISGTWTPKRSARGLGYLIAHEYFHLWNPKRLRPRDMQPYDYQHENPTPLLWVAEGITNYYTVLTMLRTGHWDRDRFLRVWPRLIQAIEENPARATVSIADASVSTWRNFDVPSAELVSYYPGGEVLGALLDLLVLNDTGGRAGLDEVLSTLWHEGGPNGSAYDTDDLIRTIEDLTGRDYRAFFERYVSGTYSPAYADIFALAGFDLDIKRRQVGDIGAGLTSLESGGYKVEWIWPVSPAAAAGLEVGDILMTTENGRSLSPAALARYSGKRVAIRFRRGGQDLETLCWVEDGTAWEVHLSELASPSEAQLRVREAWLGPRSRRFRELKPDGTRR